MGALPPPPPIPMPVMPRPPPPAAPRPPAPVAEAASGAVVAAPVNRSIQVLRSWTHVRITHDGRQILLAREQAAQLARFTELLVDQARTQEAMPPVADRRVELLVNDRLAGVLELAGPYARWSPAAQSPDSGQATSQLVETLRPDRSLMQAVLDELERLSQR